MKVYNVVLIGCGHMGEAHLEQLYDKENVCISCVCDRDIERAERFRKRFGAGSVSTDAKECISRKETDIVIIATYPSTHLELLQLCIRHKKHVLCEKPVADNPKDGREFIRLVREHPEVKVLIGHILRHNATWQKVAEMIHEGAIGSPILMRMTQNHHAVDWERHRRLIMETSPVVDCGVHYLDVMRWFTNAEIVDLSGIGSRTETDLPDGKLNYEMITARLSDGSVGYYEAGWSRAITSDNRKEFTGPKGNIRLIYEWDRTDHKEEGDLIEYYSLEDQTYHTINVKGKRKPTDIQFQCLVRMIEEGDCGTPSIEDVCAAYEASLLAEERILERMSSCNKETEKKL